MFCVVGMDRFIRVGQISLRSVFKPIKWGEAVSTRGVAYRLVYLQRGKKEVLGRQGVRRFFLSSSPEMQKW